MSRYLIVVAVISIALIGTAFYWQSDSDEEVAVVVQSQIPRARFKRDYKISVAGPTDSFFESEVPRPTQTPIAPKIVPKNIPGITAISYLVGNVDTGEIYIEKDSASPYPIASMSKLVTALIATDELSSTSTIEISSDVVETEGSAGNLQVGEKFTASDLLYPLLMVSSNDAAEALASSINQRSKFMEMMSSYAWEIGMSTAYFADPSGLNPHNTASARDLFTLAKYLYRHRPDILAITRLSELSLGTTTDHLGHRFANIHPFVRDDRFLGGKTGYTPEAGDTMITVMNIAGTPIAVVVLQSQSGSRAEDTDLLIRRFVMGRR